MQKPNWHVFLLLFCLLFLLCLARPISGQESNGISIPQSLQVSSLSMSDPWESFDLAWNSLKDELTQSELDLDVLLIQLQNLQTEVQGLKLLYLESMKQLDSLDQVNKNLLIEREVLKQDRDKWKRATFIGIGSAFVGGLVIGIIIY